MGSRPEWVAGHFSHFYLTHAMELPPSHPHNRNQAAHDSVGFRLSTPSREWGQGREQVPLPYSIRPDPSFPLQVLHFTRIGL
jgi:hypothetical protein